MNFYNARRLTFKKWSMVSSLQLALRTSKRNCEFTSAILSIRPIDAHIRLLVDYSMSHVPAHKACCI